MTISVAANAQQTATPATQSDKASAYYEYSLGHLYAEMAAAYGNRGEYFSKAAEAYRAALKADPSATFIAEELSDLYIQSGRLREAVLDAQDALKQNPNDLNARRLLARIYTHLIGDQNQTDTDMVKKAVEQYQKITEVDPKDIDSWIMLGRLQKALMNSTEAMAAYKKALELDASNEDAMTGLATVYADLGDNRAAADMLRKVADKDPNPRSLTSLAGIYEQLKDYSLAAEMLRRALDQQPGNSELKMALAEDLTFSDQLDDALKLYKEQAADDPKDIKAELRMSQIYRQKRDFAKAREAADKAKAIDPNDLEVQFNDVNLLESEGKIADAIKTLKGILDATAKKSYSASERASRASLLGTLGELERTIEQYGPAVDAFHQWADLDPDNGGRAEAEIIETYREAKDYTKAEAEADSAIKKYPKDRVVSATRSSVLSDVGKTDAAVAEAKRLMDDKNGREVDLSLADIYEKAKNFSEMAKVLDAAEALSKTSAEKQDISFRRGAMYERQKNFQAAEAEFHKVLEVNPDNDAALNYLGYMLADRNVRLEEAREMISKAVAREPNSGAYLDSMGWVLFRLNKLPEAEDKLREALRYMSRDPTVHDHLAEVYFREGKIREAIAQWQSSLREYQAGPPSDADHGEMAKVQKKLEDAKVRLAKETGSGAKPQ
ncbi:MAG TPA: tetratricopeptide repeat protein [Bryobacteraceae bacterium]|nr:tetratricopeptide repeat protein [Bryobacteraceae bacterium]